MMVLPQNLEDSASFPLVWGERLQCHGSCWSVDTVLPGLRSPSLSMPSDSGSQFMCVPEGYQCWLLARRHEQHHGK
eukprot:2124610-Ditylum_brightwellii.AAC.1